MKIEYDLAKNFAEKVYDVCFEVANDAHCYIEKNAKKNYPVIINIQFPLQILYLRARHLMMS